VCRRAAGVAVEYESPVTHDAHPLSLCSEINRRGCTREPSERCDAHRIIYCLGFPFYSFERKSPRKSEGSHRYQRFDCQHSSMDGDSRSGRVHDPDVGPMLQEKGLEEHSKEASAAGCRFSQPGHLRQREKLAEMLPSRL
jgi:hypothetical protein